MMGENGGEGAGSSRKSWGKKTPIFGVTWSYELVAGPWGPFSTLTLQSLPQSLTQGSLSTTPWPVGAEMIPDTSSTAATVRR